MPYTTSWAVDNLTDLADQVGKVMEWNSQPRSVNPNDVHEHRADALACIASEFESMQKSSCATALQTYKS